MIKVTEVRLGWDKPGTAYINPSMIVSIITSQEGGSIVTMTNGPLSVREAPNELYQLIVGERSV